MDIKKSLLNSAPDGVVTCKQLTEFYDTYHEDKEFTDTVKFLSETIHIDMAQLKKKLYASEDAHILGTMECMQKHYPLAILLMDLIPKDKSKFVHWI